ncbi:hypothetical protein FOZ63_015038, partial [Perkinsus olseni]
MMAGASVEEGRHPLHNHDEGLLLVRQEVMEITVGGPGRSDKGGADQGPQGIGRCPLFCVQFDVIVQRKPISMRYGGDKGFGRCEPPSPGAVHDKSVVVGEVEVVAQDFFGEGLSQPTGDQALELAWLDSETEGEKKSQEQARRGEYSDDVGLDGDVVDEKREVPNVMESPSGPKHTPNADLMVAKLVSENADNMSISSSAGELRIRRRQIISQTHGFVELTDGQLRLVWRKSTTNRSRRPVFSSGARNTVAGAAM